jgi:tetratricopeptide (TPR) repeat protein
MVRWAVDGYGRGLYWALGICLWLCSAGAPRTAYAEATLSDKAAAQSLFDEGRTLMAKGQYGEACPKLAESQRLDPGLGTQFNLADCYEHLGQTASAWAGFLEVASLAKGAGQADRERVARERAAQLQPKLSKLTITAAEADIPGMEIKRDGVVVGRGLWGAALPVDPGMHTVEAAAPGKKPWQTTAEVAPGGASAVVSIPRLEDAPVALASRTSGAAEATGAGGASSSSGARRTTGFIVGGLGIVGLTVSTIFALQAKATYNDSKKSCAKADPNLCDSEGVRLRNDARRKGDIATVAFGIGAAALAAGTVLVLMSPGGERRALEAGPMVGGGTAGMLVRGSF